MYMYIYIKGYPNVTPRCQHCIMFACDVFSEETSHFVLVEGITILTMDRYTLQTFVYIIQTYYENSRSLKKVKPLNQFILFYI